MARCYTSFISNLERITASEEFIHFYCLRLAKSNHQINMEPLFHQALVVFASDFEVVDISSVMSTMSTSLQQTHCTVTTCQLISLRVNLLASCENDVLTLTSRVADSEDISVI